MSCRQSREQDRNVLPPQGRQDATSTVEGSRTPNFYLHGTTGKVQFIGLRKLAETRLYPFLRRSFMPEQQKILFLCTANYYRSRFAEAYCNHLAEQLGLPVRADSAGLEMSKWRDYNPGDLSPHTIEEMTRLGIEVPAQPRAPKQFELSMLEDPVWLIALSETEHRPMMQRLFPEALDQAEFWSVEDVDFEPPAQALGGIRESVERCLESYRSDAEKRR